MPQAKWKEYFVMHKSITLIQLDLHKFNNKYKYFKNF